jgi:hypothetical protein
MCFADGSTHIRFGYRFAEHAWPRLDLIELGLALAQLFEVLDFLAGHFNELIVKLASFAGEAHGVSLFHLALALRNLLAL